jgi:enamine deaminase RidA (YjgF/YER057c/UK114 family)
VLSVLAAAGMGPRDLVKVVTFLIDRADLATARAVRDRMLQGAAPASTLRGSRQPRLADRDRGDRRRGMTRSR